MAKAYFPRIHLSATFLRIGFEYSCISLGLCLKSIIFISLLSDFVNVPLPASLSSLDARTDPQCDMRSPPT